jgi:hypothetical protein
MGTCGLSEEEARKDYPNLDVFTSDFRPMNTISGNEHRAFMKLVVDTDSDRTWVSTWAQAVRSCRCVFYTPCLILNSVSAMACDSS